MRLTEPIAKSEPPPQKGQKILWDDMVKGFALRVTPSGVKSFILNYRVQGRERRYTIGRWPTWSVSAARSEARALIREIGRGEFDPLENKQSARNAPTLEEIARRFMDEHLPRKSIKTAKLYQSILEKDVLPKLGSCKAAAIDYTVIDRLHHEITKRAPYRANRMLAVLSILFNTAIKWGYVENNPTKTVTRNPEHKRARYLSTDEIERLTVALDNHPYQQSANAIRLLLLTGSRLMEVLSATWDQFDLERGVWIKPSSHTKQKREHRVPLSSTALSLLTAMKDSANGLHLFPGKTPNTHQADLKHFWETIRKQALIPDVRVHDLRHTYASIVASNGGSLPVIGALLGHTQPITTARYAHLFDSPLREATEHVASRVFRDENK